MKWYRKERSEKHWEHYRMRREEAEGQTKYRSEGLCAAKALASPINNLSCDSPSLQSLVSGDWKESRDREIDRSHEEAAAIKRFLIFPVHW